MRTALLIVLVRTHPRLRRNTLSAGRLTGEAVRFAALAFELQLAPRDGAMVATLIGELDLPAADAAYDDIDKAARGAGALVLDLSRLTFMDSSGLRLVVRLHTSAAEGAFGLSIVRGPENVQQVFEIVGLEAVLPFLPE